MYGLVAFYNALPQWLVDISGTNVFQRVVQKAVVRVSRRNVNWHLWIRDGWKHMTCQQFDVAFLKLDIREANVKPTAFEQFMEGDSASDVE